MSNGAELLRAALREERAEARRLAWARRSRRAPLWAWWPQRTLPLEVSRAERRLALALSDLQLGVPSMWRQVDGTLYADLDGRLLRASVTSEPTFSVSLWCLSPQGEVRVTTARELALAEPWVPGDLLELRWLRAAQALRRVAWVASALGLLILLLVNVCVPAGLGLERLGALLVAAAFMLVWRMDAVGTFTLLMALLPSTAALTALLMFTPPELLIPNLLGVILMTAQAAAPLEAALWWTGHTRAGGEGGGEGAQGADAIPAQPAPTLPGMTDLTWRPDGATWRCDLPAQEGAPGIGAVTLRLRGARLTLCPVDDTTRALWDVPGAGEIALERARLGDPEVTLDSEADLIGALASGESVSLRLVDAQGQAGWSVPPFPPALT